MLQLVKLQSNPKCIYVSSKADAALVGACRRHPLGTSVEGPDAELSDTAFAVKVEMASCFNYQQVLINRSSLAFLMNMSWVPSWVSCIHTVKMLLICILLSQHVLGNPELGHASYRWNACNAHFPRSLELY